MPHSTTRSGSTPARSRPSAPPRGSRRAAVGGRRPGGAPPPTCRTAVVEDEHVGARVGEALGVRQEIPLSRVPANPWAITTHGRPASVASASLVAGTNHPSHRVPWLSKPIVSMAHLRGPGAPSVDLRPRRRNPSSRPGADQRDVGVAQVGRVPAAGATGRAGVVGRPVVSTGSTDGAVVSTGSTDGRRVGQPALVAGLLVGAGRRGGAWGRCGGGALVELEVDQDARDPGVGELVQGLAGQVARELDEEKRA